EELPEFPCLCSSFTYLELPVWPLKVRVGTNSPSLWPTISSVTYTGTCLRPSWTAKVWPTNSGKMVEARLQVLMTCFLPEAFIASTRFIRAGWTKGPLLMLLPMVYTPLLLAGTLHDQLVGSTLMLAGLAAQCGLAPGGHRPGVADLGAALHAAEGVVLGVDDVHASTGTDAHLALEAGVAQVDVLVVDVGDLAHDCGAVQGNVAHLARGQADQGVAVLLGHQLGHVAGRAHQLGAAAGVQLDVVQDGTHGDVLEGQAVAGLDVGAGAAADGVAHLQPLGAGDVARGAV